MESAPTGLIRALTSRSLARRIASVLDSRARCYLNVGRLRLRHAAYARQLARLRDRMADGDPPDRWLAGITDDFWFWLIRESYVRREDFAGLLPGFPDDAVQVGFTGNSGELMLWQAYDAYSLFRTLANRYGPRVADCGSILDFGCGWGRIIRFFLRDVDGGRLWGIDAEPGAIELCRRHDRWSRFELVTPSGPTSFPDATFDLVYSFSVFSHFSEAMHLRWLEEIRRILRPGGLLLATTRPRDFIEQSVLDRLRRPLARYPEAIAAVFPDTRRWLAAYDEGRYCYEPLAGMTDWGEACIPRPYVLQYWTKYFTILDYIDDPRRCPQNVIVARR